MSLQIQRKFVKPSQVSQYLNCPICLQVFYNATRLYCGHTFCEECLKDYMKLGNTCPQCRTTIDKKNIGLDLLAMQIINQLEIFCPAQSCPWKGILQQLEKHVIFECKFAKHKQSQSSKKTKALIEQNIDAKVMDTINEHAIKGSLQARILAKTDSNNNIPIKQDKNVSQTIAQKNKNKKNKKNKSTQDKKVRDSNFDFLSDLFD